VRSRRTDTAWMEEHAMGPAANNGCSSATVSKRERERSRQGAAAERVSWVAQTAEKVAPTNGRGR
jgi:hypothetical protein